jgi:molybdate transport system substrate-binding protein
MSAQIRTAAIAATMAAATAGIVAMLAPVPSVAAEAAELKVFTSAAPRAILREMAPVFERETGHRLAVEYAFAADLKRRIEAGNPFDVAILPPDMADDLMRQGKLVTGSRVDLGRTGLGVGVRTGAPKPDIATVEAFRRALLAAPTVAYADGGASGVQFHNILARLAIAETMKGKLRPYPSGGAGGAVARGEADLVVIGIAAIVDMGAVELVGWLPAELQRYIVYIGSVGAGAKQPQAARTLLSLLTSPAAIEIFKSHGFEPASR